MNAFGYGRSRKSDDAAEFSKWHAGILLKFTEDLPADIVQQMLDARLLFHADFACSSRKLLWSES